MARVIEGRPEGRGRRVAIVCARFNELITRELLRGCEDELARHGVAPEAITVAWVPGSYEIPLVCSRIARSPNVDAVIALGCVIRGATDHYDHVAGEASRGIGAAGRESGKPVIFGVLTTNTIEQAIERAGTKAGNKGRDAAIAALEMIDLLSKVDGLDVALSAPTIMFDTRGSTPRDAMDMTKIDDDGPGALKRTIDAEKGRQR